jgi:hypothetical protein
MSQALDALQATRFFEADENPVLPVPVKKPVNFVPPPKTRRLTIDVPADLHLRVKLECVRQGLTLNGLISELLAIRFPA